MRPSFCQWVLLSAAVAGAVTASRDAHAIGRAEIVARAQEWVDAGLLYCVSTRGAYDATCKYQCNRQDNPAWNAYFSDCSGLITWAWGLAPSQRLYTGSIAPYGGNQSYKIDPHDLQPGDALNDRSDTDGDGVIDHHHVMLFVGWKLPGKVGIFLQESGCGKIANRSEQNTQYVGDRLQVGKSTYYAVRFNGVAAAESCSAHCEGSIIVGANCGTGDCAAYGATCTEEGGVPHCAYTACPATGTVEVCLDGSRSAKCVDGIPKDIGNCADFAAFCSTIGGPHCASVFCAEPNVPPVAHTSCFIDGSILMCDDKGSFTTSPCPANTKCSVYPTPHCEANTGCPATGDVRLCLEGRAVRCYEGTLAEALDCPAQGRDCAVVGGLPSCIEDNSGDGPPPVGTAGAPQGTGGTPASAGAPASGGAPGAAGATGVPPAMGGASTAAGGGAGKIASGGQSGASSKGGQAGAKTTVEGGSGGASSGGRGGAGGGSTAGHGGHSQGGTSASRRAASPRPEAESTSSCALAPKQGSLTDAGALAVCALMAAARRRRGRTA